MRVLIISQPKDKLKVWLVDTKNSKIEAKISCDNTLKGNITFKLSSENTNKNYEIKRECFETPLKMSIRLLIDNKIIKSLSEVDRVAFSHEEIKFDGKKSEIDALAQEIKQNQIEFDDLIKN